MTAHRRISGIVLHPTSLPGSWGIGEIGPHARDFVDQLADMGQHLWQVLPLGPTSYGDSPYQSLSTFAGNHLLISFDDLLEDGLLTQEDIADYPVFPSHIVDYGPVIQARNAVLDRVAANMEGRADAELAEAYAAFCKKQAAWLDDYALFVALKDKHGGRAWIEWDAKYVSRDQAALAEAREELKQEMDNVRIRQFLFQHQWNRLRAYAHDKNVKIMGDIPIFVAHDSADVWANPSVFYLDEKGYPTVVAGVPPDYFSETGQRWGNPLYRWDLLQENGFQWWIHRVARCLEMVDLVRIDHFRGFEAYWEIDANEETAINGQWVQGPNHALFHAFKKAFPSMPIVAEDLGVITEPVEALRDAFELPGMKVLQFILCNKEIEKDHDHPNQFPNNSVCYTGTHDNDTTVGWFSQLDDETREAVCCHTASDGSEIHWDFLRIGSESSANTVIAPMQDLLGLGGEARLNLPGRPGGNWQWRFSRSQLTDTIKQRLRDLTDRNGRLHHP